jgi:hypothetical protein
VSADLFRAVALACPQAEEKSHMGHPDFRVKDKIFATLDGARGSLKLTREQQEMLMEAVPGRFEPAAGAWGLKGWTMMRLQDADEATLKSALDMAWRNTAPPKLIRELGL